MTLYNFLKVLASQKRQFWDTFLVTFSVAFRNPLLEAFLAHFAPPRCRSIRLMSILVDFGKPRGDQNPPLERPWAVRRVQKGCYFELALRSRLRLGRALCLKGVPKDTFIYVGTPLGEEGARFD